MPRDYYIGRIGGARVWVWSTAPIPPGTDTGINGHTIRHPYRLILGSPVGARAFLWTPWRGIRVLTVAQGGARIFRRRGMPLV